MSTAFREVVIPGTSEPAPLGIEPSDQQLNIAVIFTSVESTLAALKKAGTLASSLEARITLLALQVVPYPLPLEDPPVLPQWNERRFRVIANHSLVETVVRLYLCRDKADTLKAVLRPKSIVVIGGPKRRWPFTREKKLAAMLRREGHEVILSELE